MTTNDEYYQESAVTTLRGIGHTYADALQRQGIINLFDLLLDLPFRYLDETFITEAGNAKPDGRHVLMFLEVVASRTINAGRTRLFLVKAKDDTGYVSAIFFNAYATFTNHFILGTRFTAFGVLKRDNNGQLCLQHPKIVFLNTNMLPELKQTLTPVYHSSDKMPQKIITKIINTVLSKLQSLPLDEILPAEQNPFGYNLCEAIAEVHNPKSDPHHRPILPFMLRAFKRICFEELTAYQLSLLQLRRLNLNRQSLKINFLPSLHEKLLKSLPFTPTDDQKKAFAEICADLQRHTPMLRLLHGDVGSGKTMVALMACLQSAGAGYQSVLLVPTEILAEQHFKKFNQILSPLNVCCVLLYSSLKNNDRESTLEKIKDGRAQIIIGTHSAFQKDVVYKTLALAIIDEQHRFGIDQRRSLLSKSPDGCTMHQLVMTATPIPRTQQLALYADLDVSTLKQLPLGRSSITTAVIGISRRSEVINRLHCACTEKKQAYWVCPRIDESDDKESNLSSVLTAFKLLSTELSDLRIGLIHGQMSATEKHQVMQDFLEGKIDILTATTIIEVGVDVPNASIIVIESADKLGLAQLHQLRGRVGRGNQASFCLLMYDDNVGAITETAKQRLQIMRNTSDGFTIAAEDLRLRGPGEVFGARQAGFNAFKVADTVRDQDLIAPARHAAECLINDKEKTLLLIKRWFPDAAPFRAFSDY